MAVKVASLLAGTLCMYFGYKLLMRGIFPDAAEKAVWDDALLLLKRGAPGIAFALFGAALIVVTLVKSGELRRRDAPAPAEQAQPAQSSEQSAPPKESAPQEPRQRSAAPRAGSRPAPERKSTRRDLLRDAPTPPAPATTDSKQPGVIAKPGRA